MLDVAGFGIRDDGYTFYRMWYSIVHQFGLEILDEARTGLNPDPRLVEAFDTLVDSEKSWRLDRRRSRRGLHRGKCRLLRRGNVGDRRLQPVRAQLHGRAFPRLRRAARDVDGFAFVCAALPGPSG